MVVEFTACYSCTGTGFDIATTVHINWEQYFPHIEYIFILHIWDVVPILNPLLCGKIWGWDITRVSLCCTNPRPPWLQTFCDIYKMLHAIYFHVSFMVEALRYDTVSHLWLQICMRCYKKFSLFTILPPAWTSWKLEFCVCRPGFCSLDHLSAPESEDSDWRCIETIVGCKISCGFGWQLALAHLSWRVRKE